MFVCRCLAIACVGCNLINGNSLVLLSIVYAIVSGDKRGYVVSKHGIFFIGQPRTRKTDQLVSPVGGSVSLFSVESGRIVVTSNCKYLEF